MSRRSRCFRCGSALALVMLASVIAIAAPCKAAECPSSAVQLSRTSGVFLYPLSVLDTTYAAMTFSASASYDLTRGPSALL
jgi:hypothetical protein